jgi:2,3-diketo-5-methylthio-1-phosphopentane phosphatase
VRAVLLDIEGATTPMSFVHEVLFPFAAAALEEHVRAEWGSAELQADVRALAEQAARDVAAGVAGAVPVDLAASAEEAQRAVVASVRWQMAADRKSGPLKQLQGHIWRRGYGAGRLRAQVFPDVEPALRDWTLVRGAKVYIYSSGSREAQALLFAHAHADLRPLLSGYFDTSAGPKVEPASYANIALSIGAQPQDILFLTDAPAEAHAAAAAGMQVAVTARPGNAPLPPGLPFRVITSFDQAL